MLDDDDSSYDHYLLIYIHEIIAISTYIIVLFCYSNCGIRVVFVSMVVCAFFLSYTCGKAGSIITILAVLDIKQLSIIMYIYTTINHLLVGFSCIIALWTQFLHCQVHHWNHTSWFRTLPNLPLVLTLILSLENRFDVHAESCVDGEIIFRFR